MSYSVRRPSLPERQEHRRPTPRTYLSVGIPTFEHVLPLVQASCGVLNAMRSVFGRSGLRDLWGIKRTASTVLPEAWIVTVTELGGTSTEVDVPSSVQSSGSNVSRKPSVMFLYQVGANCNLPTPSLTGSCPRLS